VFYQGGGSYTGTITLVFAWSPVPALSTWGYAALVACLIGFGVACGRRALTR